MCDKKSHSSADTGKEKEKENFDQCNKFIEIKFESSGPQFKST